MARRIAFMDVAVHEHFTYKGREYIKLKHGNNAKYFNAQRVDINHYATFAQDQIVEVQR